LIKLNQGEVKIAFHISDGDETIKMFSDTVYIDMHKDILKFFNEQGWEYKLN